jgi:hypothetical protein
MRPSYLNEKITINIQVASYVTHFETYHSKPLLGRSLFEAIGAVL